MRSSNRVILIVLPVVALIGAFWFLILSPKRERAAELETEVTALQGQVAEQQQLATTADAAREDFPRAYRRLVVLGKATPEDDDTASLIVQLDRIAADTGVSFVSLEGGGGADAGAAAAPPAPADPVPPTEGSNDPAAGASEVAPASAPAPATEASAALLPIGASVGPAGLPVMKWSLAIDGSFFQLADFVAGIDDLVTTDPENRVGVRGRLVTIDSFDLAPADQEGGGSDLSATFEVTTYITPAEEGSTGGASPTGPAPATEPQTVSTEAGAPESATASTVAP